MTEIISGVSQVSGLVSNVFTAMTGNDFLVFFLSATVLGVGIGVFRKLRRAAH